MMREGLTFDDVLLVPQHSTVESRSKIDLSVKCGPFTWAHPIVPANMQTVTGYQMAVNVRESGGLAILHRFMSIEEQFMTVQDIINMPDGHKYLGVSIGIKPIDRENLKRFVDLGAGIVCVDVAHGDSSQCADMTAWIKENYKDLFLISGNVATGVGATRLWNAGADMVKVGIGPGSLCSTRVETGNGVPQMTALMDVAEAQKDLIELERTRHAYPDEVSKRRTYQFMSDGGIKSAGDIVKALCFADMVMVGNLFAGCKEAPGELVYVNGMPHKEYVGSSTHKTNHIEGVKAIVPLKGRFSEVLTKLQEGLQSGCSYQGAHNLSELKDNPEFIKITGAGLRESHPHDVTIR